MPTPAASPASGLTTSRRLRGRCPDWPIAAAAASRSLITTSAIAMPVCASAAIKACCTCMRAIAQAGLRVPGDIAVIGFDGTELAEVVSPQLTTVEQPSRAIGRTAVSLLMKRIDDPDAAVERVMMDWRVIDRASV
ncbi:MAG: substrate-binding domain-containing protein [Klebsiella pneumoniae]|nr:substrate-binding domain-containing protein [Klebsiella pneumoniae]